MGIDTILAVYWILIQFTPILMFRPYLIIFRNIIVMFRVYIFKLLCARLDKAVN